MFSSTSFVGTLYPVLPLISQHFSKQYRQVYFGSYRPLAENPLRCMRSSMAYLSKCSYTASLLDEERVLVMRFQERVDVTIKDARTGVITISPTACSAGLPYPPLKVSGINRHDAKVLLDLYAGHISEFTADNSFRYQFLVTEKSNPVFSRILHCVQANEEFHVRNIARLVKMLGGNPKYVNSNGTPWQSARDDIYGTNLHNRLKGISLQKRQSLRCTHRQRAS